LTEQMNGILLQLMASFRRLRRMGPRRHLRVPSLEELRERRQGGFRDRRLLMVGDGWAPRVVGFGLSVESAPAPLETLSVVVATGEKRIAECGFATLRRVFDGSAFHFFPFAWSCWRLIIWWATPGISAASNRRRAALSLTCFSTGASNLLSGCCKCSNRGS